MEFPAVLGVFLNSDGRRHLLKLFSQRHRGDGFHGFDGFFPTSNDSRQRPQRNRHGSTLLAVLALDGGGGSADFIFMGVGIFPRFGHLRAGTDPNLRVTSWGLHVLGETEGTP